MKKIYSLLLTLFFSLNSFAAIGPVLDNLYILGDGTPSGWNLGAQYAITKTDEAKFTWTGRLTADKRFKFRTEADSWWPCVCPPGPDKMQVVPIGTPISLDYFEKQPQGDPGYAVTETGDYVITIDLWDYKMTVTKIEVPKPSADELYLVGGATSAKWENNQALPFTKIADGVFFWTGELTTADNGEFKFINELGSWNKTVNPKGEDVILAEKSRHDLKYRPLEADAGDSKFKVTSDGVYTIQVDVNNMFMTFSQMDYDVMYIVGNAVSGKNAAWSVDDAVQMTTVAPGVFRWNGLLSPSVNSPGFKFLNGTKSWNSSVVFNQGVSGHLTIEAGKSYPVTHLVNGNDNKFLVAEATSYDVEVDLNKMMVNFAIPSGVSSEQNSIYKVYADHSSVRITTTDSTPYSAQLYDMTGRCIDCEENVEGNTSLGASLRAGVYIVRLGQESHKVVVQ